MKLSTKGEYGLRAMFDLSQRYGEGPISLKSVAERQEISEHYLEQLIAGLRKAGLVKSIRGAQGGYLLAREPKEIRVGDIIRVLEGPIAPMDCVSEEDPEECSRGESCITKTIWKRVRDSITEVLDSITLQDMCDDAAKARQENDYYMYYI
ncbi:Rrf2 family transcriptional regulator [Metallumcola ferriviriculae]|uniref:Rrf2 family transcriptional regulator n=1 Tax=Metallumcola ferriviriculae TaxID=3039180 RepID=A0AAU0USD3_9FIRM|nr:Rrf2 family transcriptional regulator [Desulfitibacteraceae bacterium MK1]